MDYTEREDMRNTIPPSGNPVNKCLNKQIQACEGHRTVVLNSRSHCVQFGEVAESSQKLQ